MSEQDKTPLALLGGPPSVTSDPGDLFRWPIVTPEMEAAVLAVLREGAMSGFDVTRTFEAEYARWLGVEFALAHSNGTAALHGAMFGLGIGSGDEIICPSMTYWASCLPAYSLGATVVFADVDPVSLCIDPGDIEHRITERTRAIMVVHYSGTPADMEPILGVARKHDLRVIEDCSHSHGSLYKGRMTGTFGDAAAFSMMSAKSFPVGEGGVLVTNDRRAFERAVIFGHYARHSELITLPDLTEGSGLPWGGYKYRLNQISSAIGREQLRAYPKQMAEIDAAMTTFWDLLADLPGVRAHRPPAGSGSTNGGWYNPLGLYAADELHGLSITRFCEAVRSEGIEDCYPGCNLPLHTHPLFNTLDVYREGKPTRIAHLPEGVDIRQPAGTLPVSETIQAKVFKTPWFKHNDDRKIEEYARAFRKVIEHHEELLPGDPGNPETIGLWGTSARRG